MWEVVLAKVAVAASPVLLAALTWVSVRLANLIKAKTKNEYLRGMLLRLEDTVFAVVKELKQTVVDELKKAAADGKLTPEEKAHIKAVAVAKVKEYLGKKGLLELVKVLGLTDAALNALIESKIEGAVVDLKGATAVAGAAVPLEGTAS